MTHSCVWLHSFMCDMTHAYVWHDSWLMHTSDWYWWTHYPPRNMTMHYRIDVTHDSFISVTWLIHVCDMTRSRVRHDSFKCMTWLIHMFDMIHSHVRHDSFICGTWLIHMCDMTQERWIYARGTQQLLFSATHYNTLQHTTTYCNTLKDVESAHQVFDFLTKSRLSRDCAHNLWNAYKSLKAHHKRLIQSHHKSVV